METAIERVVLDNGSEFIDLSNPEMTERCKKILKEAKALYFTAVQEERGLEHHDELYMKAQRYVLNETSSNCFRLDYAVKILSELAKTVEDFYKLMKISSTNRVQEKAEKQYFDAMKDKVLSDMSLEKVRVLHRTQLMKACKMILLDSDDIDRATSCITNFTEAASSFIGLIDDV